MIVEGVLAGIVGNFLHQKLADCFKEVYGVNDDILVDRTYKAFMKACELFFKKYGNEFGLPEDSFLILEENWELILRSIFYSAPKLNASNINPQSPSGDFVTPELIVEEFVEMLEKEMRRDFLLDKIVSEKEYRENTSFTQSEVLRKIEGLCGKCESGVSDEGEPLPFYYEGKEASHGKIYTVRSPNGNVMRAMVKGKDIFVEHIFNDGAIAYYEVDINGELKNTKLPYPIEEYEVVVPENLLLKEDIVNGADNTKIRTSYLMWGKKSVAVYNSLGQLIAFKAEGGFTFDHIKRKFEITQPEESN